MIKLLKGLLALVASLILSVALDSAATPPAVGDTAQNFALNSLEGQPVELSKLTSNKPVVLVVLRGWPGYQCPLCTRQVNEFVSHAADLDAAGVQTIMVYPGPAADLKAHAREFLQNKNWP